MGEDKYHAFLELKSDDVYDYHEIYVESTQLTSNHHLDVEKSEPARNDTDAISSYDLTEFFDFLVDNTTCINGKYCKCHDGN